MKTKERLLNDQGLVLFAQLSCGKPEVRERRLSVLLAEEAKHGSEVISLLSIVCFLSSRPRTWSRFVGSAPTAIEHELLYFFINLVTILHYFLLVQP